LTQVFFLADLFTFSQKSTSAAIAISPGREGLLPKPDFAAVVGLAAFVLFVAALRSCDFSNGKAGIRQPDLTIWSMKIPFK
jgi:hypothetical protein